MTRTDALALLNLLDLEVSFVKMRLWEMNRWTSVSLISLTQPDELRFSSKSGQELKLLSTVHKCYAEA